MPSLSTRRTARLLGLEPVGVGLRVARVRRVPPVPMRLAQALAARRGGRDYERVHLAALRRAHEAVGEPGWDGPRFLVRVDEFPTYSGYDEPRYALSNTRDFHATMARERLPYLMAVVPQWTHAPLDPDARGGRDLDGADREMLAQMRADGVAFGQHGDTHRSRHRSSRRRSELSGLRPGALAGVLDRGRDRLAEAGVRTDVFVAPFNRFGAHQWPVLAARYEVVTGGPENVLLMGFHPGPQWRGAAVYLPSYAPFYADAATVLPAVEAAIEARIPAWIPIVLHTGWELEDGYRSLRRLAAALAPHTVDWASFLGAVRRSRDP